MITKKILFPCTLFFALLILGCNKEVPVSDADQETAKKASLEYLEASAIFENVFQMVDQQAKQQGRLNGFKDTEVELDTRGNCPTVNLSFTDGAIFPAILELDFGDGCINDDDIPMSGKITAVFNGLLLSKGTSISLSYQDFVYAGYGVAGMYELTNQGKDADGQQTFVANVDGLLTAPDGKSLSYKALTTSKQTEGNDTNFFTNGFGGILDDVWSTSHDAALTTSEGLEVNVTTPDAIQNPLTCKYPVSGGFALNINNPAIVGAIDFGDGSCDGKALLTIGDQVIELDL